MAWAPWRNQTNTGQAGNANQVVSLESRRDRDDEILLWRRYVRFLMDAGWYSRTSDRMALRVIGCDPWKPSKLARFQRRKRNTILLRDVEQPIRDLQYYW